MSGGGGDAMSGLMGRLCCEDGRESAIWTFFVVRVLTCRDVCVFLPCRPLCLEADRVSGCGLCAGVFFRRDLGCCCVDVWAGQNGPAHEVDLLEIGCLLETPSLCFRADLISGVKAKSMVVCFEKSSQSLTLGKLKRSSEWTLAVTSWVHIHCKNVMGPKTGKLALSDRS